MFCPREHIDGLDHSRDIAAERVKDVQIARERRGIAGNIRKFFGTDIHDRVYRFFIQPLSRRIDDDCVRKFFAR